MIQGSRNCFCNSFGKALTKSFGNASFPAAIRWSVIFIPVLLSMTMTFGSLFAGIGGFDLGLERAGMTCSWQVELNDYATKILEKHWPHVERHRDVRACGAHNLKRVDLVCGGFPCQPHSLAGKRKASFDNRDLWGEFARIIRELRPRFVVAENVPGLLSSESGRFFGRVLRDLAACGYDAEWQCIPASAFGAPHRRDRVWIVAYPFCHQHWETQQSVTEFQTKISSFDRSKDSASWESGGASSIRRSCDGHGDVSHSNSNGRRLQQITREEFQTETNINDDGTQESVADTHCERCKFEGAVGSKPKKPLLRSFGGKWDWWATEPDVGRVVDGLPNRSHRLRCLGNAVVPQIVEWLGKNIMKEANHEC